MRLKLWAAIAVSSLFASTFVAVPEAQADKGDRFGKPLKGDSKGKGKGKKGASKGGEAKRFALSPQGLKFGLGLERIARLYDKAFDAEYLELYKKASPGPETEALDAQLRQKKGELRRSKVAFGNTPTGVDQTALKGEYSYANGESMGRLTLRNGTERYFFFFGDKLWKVYDEHKLKKGTKLGESFDEAVKALQGTFKSAPKRVPAAPSEGRNFDEAHWTTPDMLIRALDRGNVVALVYVDKDVQEKLPSLRKNRLKDQHKMDPDVAAALKKKGGDEPKPEDKDKGKRK